MEFPRRLPQVGTFLTRIGKKLVVKKATFAMYCLRSTSPGARGKEGICLIRCKIRQESKQHKNRRNYEVKQVDGCAGHRRGGQSRIRCKRRGEAERCDDSAIFDHHKWVCGHIDGMEFWNWRCQRASLQIQFP